MNTVENAKTSQALELAELAVARMKEASSGKPPETITETNAQTFANLAEIMDSLVGIARQRAEERSAMRKALERIAALDVRSVSELLEQGNWKKLVSELQSIAQDTLDK